MKISRTISHGAQYTALVDILFATIGVFAIVFALQDLDPPQELQPAPYDHLIVCDASRQLSYTSVQTGEPSNFPVADIRSGALAERLAEGGRVLIALAGECVETMDGPDIPASLRDLEDALSDRPATAVAPLTLFEFAPLGLDETGAEALRARFLNGSGG